MVNKEALIEHQIAIHIDELFQCQACGRFFLTNSSFEKHIDEAHNLSQNNLGNIYRYEQEAEDMQSLMLKRMGEEEKARKRTRGPYRKASSTK